MNITLIEGANNTRRKYLYSIKNVHMERKIEIKKTAIKAVPNLSLGSSLFFSSGLSICFLLQNIITSYENLCNK